MRRLRLTTTLIMCVSLLISLGCATEGTKVQGTVTLDGAPLDGATVTFIGDGGQIGAAMTDSAGGFIVGLSNEPSKGLPAGIYKITVSKVSGGVSGPAPMVGDPEYFKMMKAGVKTKNLVPDKYMDQTKSPLKVTLPEGPLSVKLELSSK